MISTANSQFQIVKERGWRRGLGNLLQGEFSSWFRSTRWLKHLLVWFLAINGLMLIVVYGTRGEESPPFFQMYGAFGGMFVAFGVMIIMQRVIIGEKRSGTAAWVLSKPVTRTAFVVSRLAVNSLAILLTAVVVPSVIVYVTFGALTPLGWLSPLGFLAGLLMFVLHTFFWLTLVVMMGTLSDSSGVVIAVPMTLYFALWFGPMMIPGLSDLVYISPLLLTFSPLGTQMDSLAVSFMSGKPVFSWLPLIMTVVYCVALISVAIWRFNRQEF